MNDALIFLEGMWKDSLDCVAALDQHGDLLWVNSSAARAFDAGDVEAMRGRPWSSFWSAGLAPAIDEAMKGVKSSGSARYSGAMRHENGATRWWDVVLTAFRGIDGALDWTIATCRDMSAHRVAGDQLALSEQRFRALADNISQLAWMADPTGYIYWYNKRWLEYTGETLDEMAGWGWKKVHHPLHVDRVVSKISLHFANGQDWEDTFPLRNANGEFRWFLSRARPVCDEQGRILVWCGTHTDITDQRDASMRLRQKARIIELSHEAIMVWELGGNIITWNRGCEELYGFDRDEAIGRRTHVLLSTLHPGTPDEFERRLKQEGSWTGELRHVAKDGTPVWVDSRQEVMRVEGRELVLETNRDITARRQASELRDLLIGELNHRVKNTLAVVQSIAAQTARSSRDLHQFTASFNERLQSLSLAQNVLTSANWTGADLRQLLRAQLDQTTVSSEAITYDGPPVFLPSQIAMQLSLLVHELATNARKHGALSVASGRIAIAWQLEPGATRRLLLRWEETGGPPVVPPLSRGFGSTLFERMRNLQQLSIATSYKTTGVVSTISAEVPEPGLKIDRIFNPGTQLQALPVAPPLAAPGEQPVPPLARARRARVLIIEDEQLIALDIELMLTDAGFTTVGPAATTTAALEMIGIAPFDLALVDGNLMGQGVDQVVAELVKLGKPFAFVTGYDRLSLPKGYDNVPIISKPLGQTMLIDTVKALSAM